MNLPFVLDVAIGLIFIYLILSLLASEIQEVITALLQWRAKHLKESIEILLAGGTETEEAAKVKGLVNELYDDPLLRNMNQQAKSGIAGAVREITRWLIPGNRKGAFGTQQATGPSYIAPETFATSLIERLHLSTLVEKLTEVRLEKFIIRIVGTYTFKEDGSIDIPDDSFLEQLPDDWRKGRIRLIAKKSEKFNLNQDMHFGTLVEEYDDILKDFRTGQATLTTCVERMGESLKNFSGFYSRTEAEETASDPGKEAEETRNADFSRRLESFRLAIFGEKNERAIVSGGLRPTLSEVAQLVNQTSNTYREVADAYQKIVTDGQSIKQMIDDDIRTQIEDQNQKEKDTRPITLANLNSEQRRIKVDQAMINLNLTKEQRDVYENYETYESIKDILSKIPNSVKDSLSILADRAQARVHQAGDEVNQFRNEVASWFDRSMARTSGVYKRNAKGVAIILGFLLAFITNSDAFYIVNRLSSDENLRQVITNEATQITSNPNSNVGSNTNPSPTATPGNVRSGANTSSDTNPSLKEQLKRIKNETDPVLRELSLPIGWNPANLNQQFKCLTRSSQPNPTPGMEPDLAEWSTLVGNCLEGQTITQTTFIPAKIAEVATHYPIALIQMIAGWFVSGFAISMGAPFWFDLLGKIMNVRNSGNKPKTPATEEAAK